MLSEAANILVEYPPRFDASTEKKNRTGRDGAKSCLNFQNAGVPCLWPIWVNNFEPYILEVISGLMFFSDRSDLDN